MRNSLFSVLRSLILVGLLFTIYGCGGSSNGGNDSGNPLASAKLISLSFPSTVRSGYSLPVGVTFETPGISGDVDVTLELWGLFPGVRDLGDIHPKSPQYFGRPMDTVRVRVAENAQASFALLFDIDSETEPGAYAVIARLGGPALEGAPEATLVAAQPLTVRLPDLLNLCFESALSMASSFDLDALEAALPGEPLPPSATAQSADISVSVQVATQAFPLLSDVDLRCQLGVPASEDGAGTIWFDLMILDRRLVGAQEVDAYQIAADPDAGNEIVESCGYDSAGKWVCVPQPVGPNPEKSLSGTAGEGATLGIISARLKVGVVKTVKMDLIVPLAARDHLQNLPGIEDKLVIIRAVLDARGAVAEGDEDDNTIDGIAMFLRSRGLVAAPAPEDLDWCPLDVIPAGDKEYLLGDKSFAAAGFNLEYECSVSLEPPFGAEAPVIWDGHTVMLEIPREDMPIGSSPCVSRLRLSHDLVRGGSAANASPRVWSLHSQGGGDDGIDYGPSLVCFGTSAGARPIERDMFRLHIPPTDNVISLPDGAVGYDVSLSALTAGYLGWTTAVDDARISEGPAEYLRMTARTTNIDELGTEHEILLVDVNGGALRDGDRVELRFTKDGVSAPLKVPEASYGPGLAGLFTGCINDSEYTSDAQPAHVAYWDGTHDVDASFALSGEKQWETILLGETTTKVKTFCAHVSGSYKQFRIRSVSRPPLRARARFAGSLDFYIIGERVKLMGVEIDVRIDHRDGTRASDTLHYKREIADDVTHDDSHSLSPGSESFDALDLGLLETIDVARLCGPILKRPGNPLGDDKPLFKNWKKCPKAPACFVGAVTLEFEPSVSLTIGLAGTAGTDNAGKIKLGVGPSIAVGLTLRAQPSACGWAEFAFDFLKISTEELRVIFNVAIGAQITLIRGEILYGVTFDLPTDIADGSIAEVFADGPLTLSGLDGKIFLEVTYPWPTTAPFGIPRLPLTSKTKQYPFVEWDRVDYGEIPLIPARRWTWP